MKNYELKTELKKQNIEKIKASVSKTIVEVGDNDLHYLSQSRNCCGIDTIPSDKFNNWLKYNLTYFTTQPANDTENMNDLYIPEGNVSSCFTSTSRIKGLKDFKSNTDHYCYQHLNFMCKECPLYDYYYNLNMSDVDGGKTVHRIRLW